jgi:hypothetical protein
VGKKNSLTRLISFNRPKNTDCVVKNGGIGICFVKITDTGRPSATVMKARCYPNGTSPPPEDTAPASQDSIDFGSAHKLDPETTGSNVWIASDVQNPNCSPQSPFPTNKVVVWTLTPDAAAPLGADRNRFIKNFRGKCCPQLEFDGRDEDARAATAVAAAHGAPPVESGRVPKAWTSYRISVNRNEGTRLLDRRGQPLRCARIAIYVRDVDWFFDQADTASSSIRRALGNYQPANVLWRFSHLYQYSVVLWQHAEYPQMVASQRRDFPLVLQLNPLQDIKVAVNDLIFPSEAYLDNDGSVEVAVRVIA